MFKNDYFLKNFKQNMSIKILSKDEHQPSTILMVASFNKSINVTDIATYLPVVHLFNKKNNQRIFVDSGTRTSIKYYGYEGIVISIGYKEIRRGMRRGAMNNMVSVDLQYCQKNIHVKLSSNTITSVGTSGFDFGVKVFELMIRYINMLNKNIQYIKSLDKDVVGKNLKWLFENCQEDGGLISVNKMFKKMKERDMSGFDLRMLKSCTIYLDDFDKIESSKYKEKILNFCNHAFYFDGDLKCMDPSIFNSVYHINIFENSKDFRIPLHKLAPYLAERNFVAEFHNWTSEGVNVCFEIEEEKRGVHHKYKDYKHRFTIHERGTMRQCSPTFREEAYKYYFGVINTIKRFFEENNEGLDFKKYVKVEE